jgi:hypothetical protein
MSLGLHVHFSIHVSGISQTETELMENKTTTSICFLQMEKGNGKQKLKFVFFGSKQLMLIDDCRFSKHAH